MCSGESFLLINIPPKVKIQTNASIMTWGYCTISLDIVDHLLIYLVPLLSIADIWVLELMFSIFIYVHVVLLSSVLTISCMTVLGRKTEVFVEHEF